MKKIPHSALAPLAHAVGLIVLLFWANGSIAAPTPKKNEETTKRAVVSLKTGIVYHPDYLLHDAGQQHPESPMRLQVVMGHLKAVGLLNELTAISARVVKDEWVTTIHPLPYLQMLQRSEKNAPVQLDPDTRVSARSVYVAKLATGGLLSAIDAVMAGSVTNAFVASRPPGHHALPSRAMGFCLINHVAIAVRYLQKKYNVKRILIVDWDVHHGNGTQDIFYDDPSVFYFSTHQFPYYPGTGTQGETGQGTAKGTNLNVPMPVGSGHSKAVDAFEKLLVPAAETFKPEFILISAGFDAHRKDPLGGLQFTDATYAAMTKLTMEIAARHSANRIVSILEGGYSVEGLTLGVESHVRELAGKARQR